MLTDLIVESMREAESAMYATSGLGAEQDFHHLRIDEFRLFFRFMVRQRAEGMGDE